MLCAEPGLCMTLGKGFPWLPSHSPASGCPQQGLCAVPRTLGAGTEQLGEPCGTGVTFAVPSHPLPSPGLVFLPRVLVQRREKRKLTQRRGPAVCAAGGCESRSVGKARWPFACGCCTRPHLGLPRGCVLLASPCMATPALPSRLPRVKRLNKNGFLFLPLLFLLLRSCRKSSGELQSW